MIANDFAESKVTIKKNELLAEIRKNREVHEKEYVEALAGFKVKFLEEAKALLARVESGKFDKQHLNLPEPVSHTKDYDRVIKMLEMSTAEEITITEQQFNQYVLDEWSWARATKILNASYTR